MISFARLARPAALALSLSLLSCGSDSTGPAPEPPVDPVTLESAHATSQTIGPEGGVLQTTANDGTEYTLTVPAGAIATGRKITMTPVTKIDGYPLAGGVVGGVELRPSGTVFAAPVMLTIQTTKTPPAGTTPVAILFHGNGTSFEPGIGGFSGNTFTIPMTHFSGGTAGFATAQELEALTSSNSAPCLQPAIAALNLVPPDLAHAFAIYDSCFTSDVLPAIENAGNDVQLAGAIGQYNMWKSDSRLALGGGNFTTFDDAAQTTQAMDALVGKLQEAIIRDNQACEDGQSLAQLANVLFWQTQAAHFGLDTFPNLLDRDTILRELCAHPVVDTIVIPSDLQVGFPHSMDIQFGLLFNGHSESQGAPFSVQLTGDGIDIQHPTGFTNSQGQYTTVITSTRDGDVAVHAVACLVMPGTTTPTDVCVNGDGTSSGTDLTGTWGGGFTGTHTGQATMVLTQNQNAITGTFHVCGGGTGPISATLSGHDLLNLGTNFLPPCTPNLKGPAAAGGCFATTNTGSVNGNVITITIVGNCACLGHVDVTLTLTRGTDPCPTP